MAEYTIGVDFGTLSARAALVNIFNGQVAGTAEYIYPHGVMTEGLPDGWALQYPQDYLDALLSVIPEAVRHSGISAQHVVGIGVDFTANTAFPVDTQGKPLCLNPEWRQERNAYAKLWKHHAAQQRAEQIEAVAKARGESWLRRYGGRISGEWALPKLWELLDEAPELYRTMHTWIEAGDWIVWQLTGREIRNGCAAGYKHFYHAENGYPKEEFYAAIDPGLRHVIRDKYTAPVLPVGGKAGELTSEMAGKLGLRAGIAVAVAHVDAHACVPAAGICTAGQMLAIMGTSSCLMVLSEDEHDVPGMCGAVQDGILPGFCGFEAGQSCVGDLFAWFCDHCVPSAYAQDAQLKGKSLHTYLTELADQLLPGESGLLALDWWNGNRSVLVDFDLSGLLMGMTLQTKPEEIYRALIEATAYGARVIVENFREHGVPVNAFYAAGGISQKNPLVMQIYADVLNMPVRAVDAAEGGALGSAIFAALAAGCHADAWEAVQAMGAPVKRVYHPIPDHICIYEQLYREYKRLHDLFGRTGCDTMKRLRAIKRDITGKEEK